LANYVKAQFVPWYINCVVDFRDELSKLTLSEHPNSLFKFYGEALEHRHDVATMPSEFDCMEIIDRDSSSKTLRQNRSSSSGFSVTERESRVHHEASSERQSRYRVINQSLDTMPSESASKQDSNEHSSPPVKSWAAILASGKTTKQSTPASVVRGSQNHQTKQSHQTKPLECSSIRSSPVTHPGGQKSQAERLKCRSASRDSDRTQFLSADGKRNRIKSNDRVSVKHQENHSTGWVTVQDKKTKHRSQTPQLRNNVSAHLAGSCTAVKSTQHKKCEDAPMIDKTAAPISQSKATKQKKKKKKKSTGSDIARDELSDAVERTQERKEKTTLPVPEFHSVDEFPSLFGSEYVSKKAALQTSMSCFTSGIFTFCLIHIIYFVPSFV